jgi:ribose 5-phosphate isomerase A
MPTNARPQLALSSLYVLACVSGWAPARPRSILSNWSANVSAPALTSSRCPRRKGGGGALLREKIVAAASERMIVIADESKCVDALGRFPLPIEIVPFGVAAIRRSIEATIKHVQKGGSLVIRQAKNGHPFVTDGGHWIIDAGLGRIDDPAALAHALAGVPGVVEHGLFIGFARTAIIGGPKGVRVIEKS